MYHIKAGNHMIMQAKLLLSTYLALYELIVPKDHKLRNIKELVDFSFVYDEIKNNYCQDNGRGAIDPIRMFKYLFLKSLYDLSDADLVERSRTDMAFKYFLDMAPEEEVIDPSSLTKFRKQRLKSMDILDLLIQKTVQIALEKDILKSKTLIVDSTHTKARYNLLSHHDALFEKANRLRKLVVSSYGMKAEDLPIRPQTDSRLSAVLEYSRKLADTVKEIPSLCHYPAVTESLNILEETIEDTLENRWISADPEARIGHKSSDSSFYGYKTHLAMTEERIITAATVTTGERHDGKQLPFLVEKSERAGIEVQEVIGDAAYSEISNQNFLSERNIRLIARENKNVVSGRRAVDSGFEYNKDAGMYVCPAGHMSVRKAASSRDKSGKCPRTVYYFNVEKCKICLLRQGCYREEAQFKTYAVRMQSPLRKSRLLFQNSPYFQSRAKQRYMIEAKYNELKQAHGYDTAMAAGLASMRLQGAMAIFAVNIKRILTLMTH
jgi:hypothetical protein